MRRALHPDAEALLALIRATGRPSFDQMAPSEARRAYAAGRAVLQPPAEAVAAVEELTIEGPGGALRLRAYRGLGTQAEEALPCLLYLHGGGWVLGDIESHDGVCRTLANAASCCVLAVDYRLAPEDKFPAALDDAAAALTWAAGHAAKLRIDAARMAVGGDSAGGNLAAVLALMGRDGTLPACRFQVLFYPVTDLAMTSDSYRIITGGVPLTAGSMQYFIDHYLPDAAHRTDWRASPLRAPSLAGTPPAFVLTVGHDPLCAEGRAYAERLETEGVRVTALHVSDLVHGVLTMGGVIALAQPVLRLAGALLQDAWRVR